MDLGQANRRIDRRSPEAKEYRKLYKTTRWARIRANQLRAKPLCEWCEAKGHIVPASVCHHEIPHKGDRTKFFAGPFVSLCPRCHDTDAQAIEARGHSVQIGYDGWPIDPHHPANAI